ncbi:MAG: HAMP domain-containing histidine kinase, partial [bacterium]|nr:HAMP domain-containing histidine kinase [bacterium]
AAGLPRNSPDSGTSMPVSYDLNLPLHLPPVQGDEGQLIQVFRNLFLNAVEALQPQQDQQEQPAQQDTEPVIWVQAENETIDADIREKGKFLLEKGKYVKLLIRDRGTGIVPEHIEKVFDPYFTTKSAPGRHGLGLTVCYSIIKKHGGHIALESAPQWGTTVTVYLPVFNGDNSRGSESK